jgi:hypothetical protein
MLITCACALSAFGAGPSLSGGLALDVPEGATRTLHVSPLLGPYVRAGLEFGERWKHLPNLQFSYATGSLTDDNFGSCASPFWVERVAMGYLLSYEFRDEALTLRPMRRRERRSARSSRAWGATA